MIRHDDLQAGLPGGGDRQPVRDAAVDGHHQSGTFPAQPPKRGLGHPVPFVVPTGDERLARDTEPPQSVRQDRRRGQAVGVIVAMDHDPFSGVGRRPDGPDRVFHAPERERVVQVVRIPRVQEPFDARLVPDAAAVQHVAEPARVFRKQRTEFPGSFGKRAPDGLRGIVF